MITQRCFDSNYLAWSVTVNGAVPSNMKRTY